VARGLVGGRAGDSTAIAAPAGTPANGRIVFATYPPPGDSQDQGIYTISADGTGLSPRLTAAGHSFDPVWSPDGRKIAFASNDPTLQVAEFYAIYVMNGDGTGAVRVTGREDTTSLNNELRRDR
jgi:Tol biopolymer transport system component